MAVFYTKLHDRLLGPLLDADRPPAPVELRRALGTVERIAGDYIDLRSSRDSRLKLVTRLQRLEHQEVLEVSP